MSCSRNIKKMLKSVKVKVETKYFGECEKNPFSF